VEAGRSLKKEQRAISNWQLEEKTQKLAYDPLPMRSA
jgi:hypothetical protein